MKESNLRRFRRPGFRNRLHTTARHSPLVSPSQCVPSGLSATCTDSPGWPHTGAPAIAWSKRGKSGTRDLNPQPLAPEASAPPNCASTRWMAIARTGLEPASPAQRRALPIELPHYPRRLGRGRHLGSTARTRPSRRVLIRFSEVGTTGFEPAASAPPARRSFQAELRPDSGVRTTDLQPLRGAC
jgi:hypothetical protein